MASPWPPATAALMLLASRSLAQSDAKRAQIDLHARSDRSSVKARQETTMPWSGPFERS
jgi:hypothetical protein